MGWPGCSGSRSSASMSGALSSAGAARCPASGNRGLTWVNPVTDRLRKVNMQLTVAAVPGQDTITRDNVTMRVDAVVYYRVVDPFKAIVNVQDYPLRRRAGRADLATGGHRPQRHGPVAVPA